MPYTWVSGKPKKKCNTHCTFMTPVNNLLHDITPLLSECNRPLKMSFEDQLNILVYFHLEEHHSGRYLLQVLKEEHLPKEHGELGDLVLIDGSLIDAVLSMYWADYRKGSKKANVHVGFDLNRNIPKNIFLTDGKEAERPFVDRILAPRETGIIDRGYQSHKRL